MSVVKATTFDKILRLFKTLKFLWLSIFLALSSSYAYAQSIADWWYFGSQAGVHFSSNGPVADASGQITTNEGSATIADENGNLLFYTDGIRVFDANHVQMPNGFGLNGSNSASQAAVILRKPSSVDSFFIFTVDEQAQVNGLRYTLVDMNLNGGFGDVVSGQKNVPLLANTAEKITVVLKDDDAWIITHKLPGDTIFAFEVTSVGVNTNPVTSQTGFPLTGQNFWGYMRANMQGNQIAFVSRLVDDITLMDFDKATGQVSNAFRIEQSINGDQSYGIEFSPNGKFLYATSFSFSDVRQYNLTLGTPQEISGSEIIIGSSGLGGGALQLGPDCKIYGARKDQGFLSAIENPNVLGEDAGYIDTAVILTAGRQCEWGLPGFAQACAPIFYDSLNCLNDSTYFILDTTDIDLVEWNFDDLGSGINNTSTDFFPVHLFSDTGLFTVRLIYETNGAVDTIFQTLKIFPRQVVSLPTDTAICNGDSLRLGVTQPYADFLWSNGSTSDSIILINDTLVSVTVFGICDTVSANTRIRYDDPINLNLGPDTTVCGSGIYTLNSGLTQDAVVQWSTGDSTPSIQVNTSGTYVMNAINACGAVTDEVSLVLETLPTAVTLPEDTITCAFNSIDYSIERQVGSTYFWNTGDTGVSISVDTTMKVWVAKTNICGTVSDTVNVLFSGVQVDLGSDTTICDLDSLEISAFNKGAIYSWNTGDTTASVIASGAGANYNVTVTRGICEARDGIRVDYSNMFCEDITCTVTTQNVFTPNGDGLNDIWRAQSDCYIVSFDLTVYSRWGQLVHRSSNIAYGWDGYIRGRPAPEGTYYYELIYRDNVAIDNDRLVFRGEITLIRD